MKHVALLLLAAFSLLVACSSGVSDSLRQFGEPCGITEDCASKLCVNIGGGNGVCTNACVDDAACPTGPNWACVEPGEISSWVCGCVGTGSEICGDGLDNDCNGSVDDCRMCAGETVPDNDPGHCGKCGNACRATETCIAGECGCGPKMATVCGGDCADLTSSAEHCGECDKACEPGQICSSSACECPASARTLCPDVGCVDTASDRENCGGCASPCRGEQQCEGGECTCPEAGATACDGDCVDTAANISHCGACNNDCGAGQSCEDGVCVCTNAAATNCGSVCVDLNTDTDNCGRCRTTCPGGQVCQGGICSCNSASDTACGNECVDTDSDPLHCGGCRNTCKQGESCSSGSCTCGAGRGWCNPPGECVDLGDVSNCGACGNSCRSGEVCSAGACGCANSSEQWCSGMDDCVPLNTTQNCGGCGNTCQNGEVCLSGSCRCASLSEQWCATANTCVDTQGDRSHCGACGNVCRSGEVCLAGSCRCPNGGDEWCAATNDCVDVSSNESHCGRCDRQCPGTTTCTSGECECPPPTSGTELRLTSNSGEDRHPRLAFNGTHVGLTYRSDGILHFALLNPDGTRAAAVDRQLSDPTDQGSHQEIVWTGSEFGIWYAFSVPFVGCEQRFLRLDPTGAPNAPPVTVATLNPLFSCPSGKLTWSDAYQGYAAAYWAGAAAFHRLGADATSPEPPVQVAVGNIGSVGFAVDALGGWGLVYFESNEHRLALFDATGSQTVPHTVLNDPGRWGSQTELHDDGVEWLSSWVTGQDLIFNRGTMANGNFTLVSRTGMDSRHHMRVAGDGTLTFAWRHRPAGMSGNSFEMQRFNASAGASSVLDPLSAPVSIVSGTLPTTERDGTSVVITPTGLLAAWTDERFGQRELFVRAFDFGACP